MPDVRHGITQLELLNVAVQFWCIITYIIIKLETLRSEFIFVIQCKRLINPLLSSNCLRRVDYQQHNFESQQQI